MLLCLAGYIDVALSFMSSLSKKETSLSLGNSLTTLCSSPPLGREVKQNLQLLCYQSNPQKEEIIRLPVVVCHITNPCPYEADSFHPLLKKMRGHIPKTSFDNLLQSPIPMAKGVLRKKNMQHLSLSVKWQLFPYFH